MEGAVRQPGRSAGGGRGLAGGPGGGGGGPGGNAGTSGGNGYAGQVRLTYTAPNEIAITVPLATMQGIAPGLYSFDLVVTYGSGTTETILAGQVLIVQGIA